MNQKFQALVDAVKAQVTPIGTVIASLIAPDATNDYMSGTTDRVWAFADGSNPASSYTGPFPDMRGNLSGA